MVLNSITKEHVLLGMVVVIVIVVLIMNYCKSNRSNPNRETFHVESESCSQKPTAKLVLYYTEWCPHSMRFRPVWDNFVSTTNYNIPMEAIDCVQYRYKCHDPNICGFPEILLYKDKGSVIKFSGERSVRGLENFLRENLQS